MKIIVRRVLTELIYYGNMLAHYHTKANYINEQFAICNRQFAGRFLYEKVFKNDPGGNKGFPFCGMCRYGRRMRKDRKCLCHTGF